MKKLFFIMLLAISATANAANNADNDTIIILKPQKVRIITGDSIQKIKVYGRENDSQYRYENTIQLVDSNYISSVDINKDRWDLSFGVGKSDAKGKFHNEVSSHFGLGLTLTKGSEGFDHNSFGDSWELFWTIAQWDHYTPSYKNWYSVGFGVDWRNYRLDGRQYFMKQPDGSVTVEDYPAGYEPSLSRIKIFSLNIPLLWGHKVSKNLKFSIGPVFNFNTYASIKNRYRDADGKGYKDVYKHIHQKPLTIDLMAIVKVVNFQFYGKFSPMDCLNSNYADGANFSSMSFGVYF